MATVTIDVTQNDIDKGVRFDARKCPISRAIRRAIRRDIFVSTGMDRIRLLTTGTYYQVAYLETPRKLARFIRAFDSVVFKRQVRPTTFRLAIPDGALRKAR